MKTINYRFSIAAAMLVFLVVFSLYLFSHSADAQTGSLQRVTLPDNLYVGSTCHWANPTLQGWLRATGPLGLVRYQFIQNGTPGELLSMRIDTGSPNTAGMFDFTIAKVISPSLPRRDRFQEWNETVILRVFKPGPDRSDYTDSNTARVTGRCEHSLCLQDLDCQDEFFCNGRERCLPGAPGANVNGCRAATEPTCLAGQECSESRAACTTLCPDGVPRDADGDMHVAAACGGDDCDDHDPNRYGGNREVCDAAGHDEDCDPLTYGHLDVDGDGFDDIRCYNRDRNGHVHAGTDFDDLNPAIHGGSMVCDGPDAVIAFSPAPFPRACPTETKCVVQPNMTGICVFPGANYVPPPRWVPPATPGALPPLETLISPENMGLIQRGMVPTPTPQPSPDPQTKIQQPVAPPLKNSAGGNAAEVAECKSILQSGKIFWGAGTNWTSENIDRLCNGTTNAKQTIECFEANVEKVGWTKAIDNCK